MPDVRLIDANALQRAFDDAHKDKPDYYCCNFLNNAGNPSTEWDCVDDILESAPTIDAQPVKQGHWIRKAIFYVCSECDIKLIDDNFEQIAIFPNGYMPFCPNCNAKME